MNHGKNINHIQVSIDTLVKMYTTCEGYNELVVNSLKERPFVFRPPVTYNQSGSPYGIADKFHNRLTLGQCYTRASFEIKLK